MHKFQKAIHFCTPRRSISFFGPYKLVTAATKSFASKMSSTPRQIRVPNVTHQFPENAKKVIGTHDGTFHCDEALACAMLTLTEEFQDAEIVRTRNEEILRKCAAVCDVGAVYDPENRRFDHHQSSFTGTFNDKYKTKLSTAGLVYKHFGQHIISRVLNTDEKTTNIIYDRVYKSFIEHIDGIDNGIEVSSGPLNYKITTHLPSRVGALNPRWNDPAPNENEGFKKAIALTGCEFLDSILYWGESWLPARSIVEECLAKRHELHPSGEIMKLDRFCPWQEHLFDLETEQNIYGTTKYVLFQDTKGSWRVQAVSTGSGSFTNRMPLPAEWRGLRDQELSDKSGIPGCIFVHASGFIGGNKNYEGALQMAIKALEIGKQAQQQDNQQQNKKIRLEE